jgi:hypothetical protein
VVPTFVTNRPSFLETLRNQRRNPARAHFDIRDAIPKQPELPTEIQPVEDPQIEPEPKQDAPSGIPGFGIESIITGILSSAIILMLFRRAREQVYGIET